MKTNKKVLIAALAAVVLIAAMVCVYFVTRPEAVAGAKTVTVQVVHLNGEEKTFTLHTDAEFLGQALTECEDMNVGSEDGPYGIYIRSVDGEDASDEAHTYWCLTQNGEMLTVGADQQPVQDGEHYELSLITW